MTGFCYAGLTAVTELLYSESVAAKCFFIKKKPPGTISKQLVNSGTAPH
jgi:hypothetical protein